MVILLSSAISAYDMCTISNTLFGLAMKKEAAKSFPMWSKGSIIIAQFSKYKITISQNRQSFSMSSILKRLSILSGSRGPGGPDLPSPLGRKSQLSGQMDGEPGRFGALHWAPGIEWTTFNFYGQEKRSANDI